ncbi:Flp family type IVb pilin [Mariniblastus fucicola]|uniref:Flp/Fap pilin component n=1 Tax=Mariniblastus fucicola TaxID=980251 RepID=A0A5B9PDG0_9BACT|nr:Flp family type IVb pilin [Mariniblastus fucicola]QEG24418.1 Flp/Fap pilin component [Mariniblastus fucicola]
MQQLTKQKIARFLSDESGPTAVEYAVMLALILAVCIAAFATMGSASANLWTDNTTQIDTFMNN